MFAWSVALFTEVELLGNLLSNHNMKPKNFYDFDSFSRWKKIAN